MLDTDAVLTVLDEIEGFRPSEPDASLYMRAETPVTLAEWEKARLRALGYLPGL